MRTARILGALVVTAALFSGCTVAGDATVPFGRAVTAGSLEGRWLVVDADDSAYFLDSERELTVASAGVDTYLEFTRSTWRRVVGTDPLCVTNGTFAEVGGGELVAQFPSVTWSIGCPGLNVNPLVAATRAVRSDGDELLLLDADGEDLVRLSPATDL